MFLKFFQKKDATNNSSDITVYNSEEIISFNENGIALNNGVFIDFRVCIREFSKCYGKSSFKCVAERNIDAKPPYFEFFMPMHIRIVFDKYELFQQFRQKLESFSYTSYDLT